MTAAILIIDVQNALFDPEPRPFDVNKVLENINSITDWARKCCYPVIYIQHEQAGSVMEYKSQGWQLQADLIVENSDLVVRKTTPDSFLRTDLAKILESKQIKHLIVAGYASEFCVDTTIRRAASLGFSVELVSDAHTTHDKEHATGETIRTHHNCTLPNITSFGVKISTVKTSELVEAS